MLIIIYSLTNAFIGWSIHWLTDWSIELIDVIHSPLDWLNYSLISWLIHFIHSLDDLFVVWYWLNYSLINWLIHLFRSLSSWLSYSLCDWQVYSVTHAFFHSFIHWHVDHHQRLLEQNCAVKLELEVRPRFLVTDTNCFIDHLSSLRSIVAMATYTLVVPLVGQSI